MCRWAPDTWPTIARATPRLGEVLVNHGPRCPHHAPGRSCGCRCYAKDRALGPYAHLSRHGELGFHRKTELTGPSTEALQALGEVQVTWPARCGCGREGRPRTGLVDPQPLPTLGYRSSFSFIWASLKALVTKGASSRRFLRKESVKVSHLPHQSGGPTGAGWDEARPPEPRSLRGHGRWGLQRARADVAGCARGLRWVQGDAEGRRCTHRSLLSWAKRLLTSSTVTSKNSSGSSAGQAWSSSSRSGWHTTGSRSTGCWAEGLVHAGPRRGPGARQGEAGPPRPCSWGDPHPP